MQTDPEKQIREYFERNANVPVPVQDIRRDLKISEVNVVESVVLKNLNAGRMELTPQGVRLRINPA